MGKKDIAEDLWCQVGQRQMENKQIRRAGENFWELDIVTEIKRKIYVVRSRTVDDGQQSCKESINGNPGGRKR